MNHEDLVLYVQSIVEKWWYIDDTYDKPMYTVHRQMQYKLGQSLRHLANICQARILDLITQLKDKDR